MGRFEYKFLKQKCLAVKKRTKKRCIKFGFVTALAGKVLFLADVFLPPVVANSEPVADYCAKRAERYHLDG